MDPVALGTLSAGAWLVEKLWPMEGQAVAARA